MKASQFFKTAGRFKPAPSHPVALRLVNEDGGVQSFAEAEAVFRFVPQSLHDDAGGDAAKALATSKTPVTDERRRAEEQVHLLYAALRDKSAPAEPFFDDVETCRAMLMPDERIRLLAEYQHFVETHFPESITPEKFKEMVEDASTFSVSALLSKYGYWPTRRALASLAVRFGTSLTS